MATRWGIVSTGNISNDFVTALQLLPDTEQKVVAVSSRKLENAKTFAEKFNINKYYGSHDELSQDGDIDIVYIGSIIQSHAKLTKMMLEAGKPVLCEVNMCMNTRETSEVIAMAKEKKVFLMEGFWSRCFPVYDKLRQALKDGEVGEVRIVSATFGFDLREMLPRMLNRETSGGSMEICGFIVQLTDLVFGGPPEKISATGTLLSPGIDENVIITLSYPGGRLAVLTCSMALNLNERVMIYGTKGGIEIPKEISCPTDIIVNGEKFHYPLPECSKSFNYVNCEGFTYEIQHVRDLLWKGAIESPLMTHESSLTIAKVLDEARRQVGVLGDPDKV